MAGLPPGASVAPSDGMVVIRLENMSFVYDPATARAIAQAILGAAVAAPTQKHLAIHGKLDAPQRPRWQDIPGTAVVEENAS